MTGSSRLLSALISLLIPIVLAGVGVAQQAPEQKPALGADTIAQMKQLQQAALNSDYAWQQLEYLSDSIGARGNGSPQQQAAVEYVAGELRKLGLDVHTEKVTIPHWVRGEERAELVSYPGRVAGTKQRLVVTALGGSVATPADGLTADVVVAHNFDELAKMPREQVAGKIVVFDETFDEEMALAGNGLDAYGGAVAYRGGGPTAASQMGAIAVLVRSAGSGHYRLAHTGVTGYRPGVAKIPAGALAAEDADLIDRLAKRGLVKVKLVLTPQTLPEATTDNVIADIKGSEHPEQVVIVSGHLDSWELGTGAIDDGAGVAMAMEVANLIRKSGLKPKRTIRIVAWACEEYGLNGARQYAKDYAADMANHYAAIESDLGADHPMGVEFNGDKAIEKLLEPVSGVLESSGGGIVRRQDEAGSDIIVLGIMGVPTFAPIQDVRQYFKWHHTAADTLDKVTPVYLRQNAAIMTVLAYALANMDAPIEHHTQPVPEWMK